MRTREEISKEYKSEEHKILETLFDIRDLLIQKKPKRKYIKKVRRQPNVNSRKENS